jgi:hypothetical protein
MSLLIHLLRLRPSPEQLSTWNDDDSEYNEIHVTQGWTAFLKDLAGPETFDEMPRTPIDKVKKRRKYMDQMYEIASMEEEIQNEERGKTMERLTLAQATTLITDHRSHRAILLRTR